MKLALIGCGFMGEALLKAALRAGVLDAGNVTGAEISEARRAYIGDSYGIRTTPDPAEAASGADILLFAIKPQEFAQAARALSGKVSAGQSVVSIMAGARIDTIRDGLNHDAIVRVMPNTPAAIAEGVSVWTATAAVSAAARESIAALLQATGTEVFVEDEKYLDMATALSGSGPGFVYVLIEAFIDAGVHIGFRRDVAEQLALQTFAGSAKYAQARGVHVAQLRNEVTSPSGTTAAGLQVLEKAGIRGVIVAAIEAAFERSRELGGG